MNTPQENDFGEVSEHMTGPRYIDLYAKVHAFDIHESRGTPDELRPRISRLSLTRAHDLAYERIVLALKYFEEGYANEETDKELQHAAQLLEKLYLNRSVDDPHRTKELHTAALSYYLAGHYARAFVLMRGVTESTDSSTNLMRLLFLRELSQVKSLTLLVLSQNNCIDKLLANSVWEGEIDEIESVNYALEGTINRVYLFFYEYARTGKENLIEQAIAYSHVGRRLSIEQRLPDWWWVFQCTTALLREYHRSSLWACLRPLMDGDVSDFVKHYIQAAFMRHPLPILELWRTQSHVVENIKDGKSYCLKMPTSAGKTRIAELAILKFLVDTQATPEKKCLYIAPYRSLAVELEESLRRSFEPIEIGVSQLYGSYDLNPAESWLVDKSKILIATPEKIDAFLRYKSDLAQQIGLIIVDEGHIIDPGERGLRYELFLHRYIRRYERNGVRFLFISAVMPNVEQFAQWITGRDTNAVLASDWRASQLLLGTLRWDGQSGRVNYRYRDQEKVDQSFFISNYFTRFDPQKLRAAGCNRRLYPGSNATRGVLTALAAIQATNEGSTLVFTPQKDHLASIAKSIIEVVELQEQINRHFRQVGDVLPRCVDDDEKAQKLSRCIRYAEETTGADSIVVKSLKCGFVLHSGNVPKALRVHLEELIREGILQLVVANTTLAQGVNLPVRTIIIHSLYNKGEKLRPRDFWNLCGRAGRAMHETEGHVYLIADVSRSEDEYDDANSLLDFYVNKQKQTEKIISSIRQLLEDIVRSWQRFFPQFGSRDIAELCQILANDEERNWLSPELQRKLRILDASLLALIQEQDLDIADAETDYTGVIAALFKDSMLYIQLNSDVGTFISSTEASSLIVQRVQHISRVCKTKQRRQCYYSMALSIEGCITIEKLKKSLAEYLKRSENFMDWSDEVRARYIVKLSAEFLMRVDDIRLSSDNKEPPDCWPLILEQWLMGKDASEIAKNTKIADDWRAPMKISAIIDDLCDYRLPWGLNAISMFWKTSGTLTEDPDEMAFTPPDIVNYFGSMLRYGVHDPVATVALALGIDDRKAALQLSTLYHGAMDPTSILIWLEGLDQDTAMLATESSMLQDLLSDFILSMRRRKQFIFPGFGTSAIKTLEALPHIQETDVAENMVLISAVENKEVHLYTPAPDAVYINVIILQNDDLLNNLKRGTASVIIKSVNQNDNHLLLTLFIG